ncbi:hypothetical protein NDU88_000615 [Pleurodeles waltl]|uniref:Uncharacterized protein n=1 Tax=Pleurodeles waltl TaxID=8319 RepID=A0AAV7SXJ0_PLEWA|nr:hypothetical protein NDU88_000615 [Pleurodeles waltl]
MRKTRRNEEEKQGGRGETRKRNEEDKEKQQGERRKTRRNEEEKQGGQGEMKRRNDAEKRGRRFLVNCSHGPRGRPWLYASARDVGVGIHWARS